MRDIAANALTLLILAGVVILGLALWGIDQYRSEGPHQANTVVMIPPGARLGKISDELEKAGVISDARIFRIGARYQGKDDRLRYGEYEIPAGASMEEVMQVLIDGKSIQHRITIPEGLTSWEIVERLKASDVLTGEIAEVPPEGSLAPDTYLVQRGQKRSDIIALMQRTQAKILDEAWEKRADDLPIETKEEALILASIVEKETGLPDERNRVAAVFVNRLRKGMKLQTDPTVIYGITGGKGSLGRGILRSELDAETPYNTYVIEGLPPTPITNPGRDAIVATLNPSETKELYFVADGSGGHAFAETLNEHNRNVAEWRKIEAERKAAADAEEVKSD